MALAEFATHAEIPDFHVTLEVECIDRMYLNLYVPSLQHVDGAVGFFRYHRKQAVASTALMRPMSEKFVSAIESFTEDHQIPVVAYLELRFGAIEGYVLGHRRQPFQLWT